jgi:hypothetical protein
VEWAEEEGEAGVVVEVDMQALMAEAAEVADLFSPRWQRMG